MKSLYELTNSTYSGYNILIPRITYLSKVGYNTKLKEYYLDIGYESQEFSKFTLSFGNEEEAEKKRYDIIKAIESYYQYKKQ